MRVALVPVKRLDAGKSRLRTLLDPKATHELILAMLGDVIEALRGAREIDRVAVVTPDATVGAAARASGAEALLRADTGLNPSLDAAAQDLLATGADSLLVVLGDVAGISSEDVSALFGALEEMGGRGAVLAPARDGGTTALLRVPPDAIPHRFGPESAAAHEAAARKSGVPFRRLERPSLAIDLDRPEDLDALLRSDAPAPRTRALLRERGIEVRP